MQEGWYQVRVQKACHASSSVMPGAQRLKRFGERTYGQSRFPPPLKGFSEAQTWPASLAYKREILFSFRQLATSLAIQWPWTNHRSQSFRCRLLKMHDGSVWILKADWPLAKLCTAEVKRTQSKQPKTPNG